MKINAKIIAASDDKITEFIDLYNKVVLENWNDPKLVHLSRFINGNPQLLSKNSWTCLRNNKK